MNGNLDTSDVLLNRGLNGGYYGANVGNFLGDGSAVKAATDSVSESLQTHEITRTIGAANSERSITDAVNASNQFLSDRIWSQGIDNKFANVTAAFASMERLAFANKADTDRDLKAIELKQVECCCELKAGQAQILAEVTANQKINDSFRQGQNQALLEQLAAGNGRGQGNG